MHVRALIMHQIRRLQDVQEKFQTITGSIPQYHLVIVVNESGDIQKEKWNRTLTRAEEANIDIIFMNLSDLGYSVTK